MALFDLYKRNDENPKENQSPVSLSDIALAVKVFEEHPNEKQEGVCALIARKMDRSELAIDLYRFIPTAYGRVLISEVDYPDKYLVEKGEEFEERFFSNNAVYAEVKKFIIQKLNKNPSQGDMMNVLSHSAEFNAINQALHGGSKLEDLILSPPIFLDNE